MITAKTYRAIDIALRQVTKMYIIPFTWNSAKFKLVPITHLAPRHLFWPLSVFAYSVVLLVSKFVNSEALATDQVKSVLYTIFFIIYTCVSVIVLNVLLNREHIACFFNQYFRFIRRLDAAGHIEQQLDISYIILRSFHYISYSHCLSGVLLYFEFPRNPNYLHSLVPEAYDSWFLIIACGAFEFAFYVNVWQYGIFSFIMLFPYFYGTLYWLREIIYQANRPKRLSPESTYAIYKCFQILAQEFNCCFGQITIPSIQFYLILLAVMGNHILLLHYHELSVPAFAMVICVSAVAICTSLIIFPRAAQVNSLSTRFIKMLEAKAQAVVGAVLTKGHVRACFPLKIRINSFAYIVRFTTVRIVGLIFYWTVRSVLLTRN